MIYNCTQKTQIGEFHTNPEKCNECNGEDLIEDKKRGDIICKNCGLVLL